MLIRFWLRSPLFEAAADGAGSGGGDGAGAGNSGAASFDPVAFKAEMISEFNKTINGFGKTLKNDFNKAIEGLRSTGAGSGSGSGSGDGNGDGAGSGGSGSGSGAGDGAGSGSGSGNDAKLNALQLELKREREANAKRLKDLEDKYTAAETEKLGMARDKALTDALGKFEFLSPEARNTAAEIFRGKIQRTEDGEFVAGDLPLDKFIESELPGKHAYLLKAKDVSGAGARSGKGGGSSKFADLDNTLRPENFSKLTPAEQAEVRELIKKANGF